MSETRVYPICCTSAYCGKIDCPPTCRNLPELRSFKEWRERTDAQPADRIWSPLVYVAPAGGRRAVRP